MKPRHKQLLDEVEPQYGAQPLLLAMALLAVCVSAASFFPSYRLWGINHLAFYPQPVRLAAIVVLALVFIPAVARAVYSLVSRVASALATPGRRTTLVLLSISAVSVAVFAGLRSATTLLGDGQLILRGYEAAHAGRDDVVMSSLGSILTREPIAKGSMLLYYAAAKLATEVFGASPGTGLRALNCVLGGLFVFLLLLFLRGDHLTAMNRVWIGFLVLFSGTMELFFGYVENYTALTLVTFVYAFSGLRVLRANTTLWPSIILFALAVFTHIQALLLTPSLILLVVWRLRPSLGGTALKYSSLVMSILMFAWLIFKSAGVRGDSVYLPLFANDASTSVLSRAHLLDVLNEMLLLLPILPMVALMIGIASRRTPWAPRERTARSRISQDTAAGTPTRWFSEPVEWHFAYLMFVPCLLYLLAFNAEIGVARDWDLFSMLSVGLVLLTVLGLNRYCVAPRARAILTIPALVFTAVLGMAWFGVNASSDRSAARLQSILAYDQSSAPYAYENLAIHFERQGNLGNAIAMMQRATEISRNPRQYVRLAIYQNQAGEIQKAIGVLEQALERHPDHEQARRWHVKLLAGTKEYDKLLLSARAGIHNDPYEPLYHLCYGESLIQGGHIEEGIAALRTCLSLNPPADARQWIDEQLRLYTSSPE